MQQRQQQRGQQNEKKKNKCPIHFYALEITSHALLSGRPFTCFMYMQCTRARACRLAGICVSTHFFSRAILTGPLFPYLTNLYDRMTRADIESSVTALYEPAVIDCVEFSKSWSKVANFVLSGGQS